MKLPLVVYGLLFVLLMLVYTVFQARKARRPAPAWGSGEKAASGQAMAEVVSDALRVLVLLVGAALLSITFGKPGLLPQYAAWAVVVGQVLKSWAIYVEQKPAATVLRVVVLLCLGYIWFMQLPLFDYVPR
ncbi:MAG TPA: hypothetical protein VKB51_03570 [bacterium]|nr:hypothetical protein [bacterium]